MTEETQLDEAEIITEEESVSDTSDTEEIATEEVEVEEVVTPQPKKPVDKFAKKLAELNEAKRKNETLELERDVALIKAKYGNEIDEAKIQEIKLKHKDLSNDEVYAIYSIDSPKSVEQEKPRQNLKVVGQKPTSTTKVFTYETVSKLSQAEYNQVMDQVKQGKAILKPN